MAGSGTRNPCTKCGKPWSADAFHKGCCRCKECRKAQYEDNKPYFQKYYQQNKAKYNKNKSLWLRNNPDQRRARDRASRHRRRAKERGSSGSYTAAEVKALFEQQRGRCAECAIRMTIKPGPRQRNLDHIQPLALGGSNSIENLQWLCQKCNNEKGAMDPYEWAKLRGRLFV